MSAKPAGAGWGRTRLRHRPARERAGCEYEARRHGLLGIQVRPRRRFLLYVARGLSRRARASLPCPVDVVMSRVVRLRYSCRSRLPRAPRDDAGTV